MTSAFPITLQMKIGIETNPTNRRISSFMADSQKLGKTTWLLDCGVKEKLFRSFSSVDQSCITED